MKFNFLSKIIFSFKKPKIIIITGKGRSCAAEAVYQVLRQHLKVKKISDFNLFAKRNEILILETKVKNYRDFDFLVKYSQLPILVVTHSTDIPFDKDFFSGEKRDIEEILKLAKILPSHSPLILNFDDETIREIKDFTNLKTLTFGFQEKADFRATDIKLNFGTNFKLNFEGNIVPIWLDKIFGKEQIYSALVACTIGAKFGLNLVEISQALKNYQSLPGKMRLIKGIKNSLILDDSESASVFSMIEALEIFGKIEIEGRKMVRQAHRPEQGRRIAVLGDILGIGKYSIEAHEAIGERVARTSNLLFTVGSRAKFIAQGAYIKGMPEDKIFQFNKIEEARKTLRNEIKEGDLILVDGSKEMEMKKIVEEIIA